MSHPSCRDARPDPTPGSCDGADAVDSVDGRAVLSRTTLMTLRRVLHAWREGWLLDERLAAAGRMVADDARLCGLGAPRMVVALKAEWAALEAVRDAAPRDARLLLDRLVTDSIAAFYRRHGLTPTAGPDGPLADVRHAA